MIGCSEAARIERFIRAFTFPPHPAAKACLAGQEVEIRAPVVVGEVPVRKIYHQEMKQNTKMVPFKSWYSIIRPLFLIRLGLRN